MNDGRGGGARRPPPGVRAESGPGGGAPRGFRSQSATVGVASVRSTLTVVMGW